MRRRPASRPLQRRQAPPGPAPREGGLFSRRPTVKQRRGMDPGLQLRGGRLAWLGAARPGHERFFDFCLTAHPRPRRHHAAGVRGPCCARRRDFATVDYPAASHGPRAARAGPATAYRVPAAETRGPNRRESRGPVTAEWPAASYEPRVRRGPASTCAPRPHTNPRPRGRGRGVREMRSGQQDGPLQVEGHALEEAGAVGGQLAADREQT